MLFRQGEYYQGFENYSPGYSGQGPSPYSLRDDLAFNSRNLDHRGHNTFSDSREGAAYRPPPADYMTDYDRRPHAQQSADPRYADSRYADPRYAAPPSPPSRLGYPDHPDRRLPVYDHVPGDGYSRQAVAPELRRVQADFTQAPAGYSRESIPRDGRAEEPYWAPSIPPHVHEPAYSRQYGPEHSARPMASVPYDARDSTHYVAPSPLPNYPSPRAFSKVYRRDEVDPGSYSRQDEGRRAESTQRRDR